MKTPAEIHAEVGTEIRPGTASLLADSGCRAFTVSDIEKIIADAKAESHSEIATLRKNHSDTMRVIKEVLGYENWPEIKGNFNEGVHKLLREANGGVCEWRKSDLHHQHSSCGNLFKYNWHHGFDCAAKYCPGCGKEIKIV